MKRLNVGEDNVGATGWRFKNVAFDEVSHNLALFVLLLVRENVLGRLLGVAQLELAHGLLATHLGLKNGLGLGQVVRPMV